jgi:hypothetical protein
MREPVAVMLPEVSRRVLIAQHSQQRRLLFQVRAAATLAHGMLSEAVLFWDVRHERQSVRENFEA